MPRPETSDLHQKAVFWEATGNIDDNGEPIVTATKVEINARWEIKRNEFTGSRTNTVAFDELAVVDREITIGSILRLGALIDLPSPEDNLRKVVDYSEIPDVKNRAVRRVVMMIKRSDRLPTTA